MNKVKTLLIAIIILFLGYIALWFSVFGKFRIFPTSAPTPPAAEPEIRQTQEKAYLSVVFESRAPITYEREITESESVSAFDLLKEGLDANQITYETQSYDFGVFVKSINGFESGAEKSWIYFVNGVGGSIASDQYELDPGDRVEWKYITPSQ